MITLPLRVMEPKSREELPSKGYLYQVKWDGMRLLAIRQGSRFLFQTKSGKILPGLFPELLADLDWLPSDSIIDGEVVVLREGKPHFPSLLKRFKISSREQAGVAERFLTQGLGVEYIVFDVLQWAGVDWRGNALSERLTLLADNLPVRRRCQGIETFTEGNKLWAGVQALGLEGVVAKAVSSCYVGGKNDAWLKIKNWQEDEFIIGGVKMKGQAWTSVCLGRFDQLDFSYVGSVSNGLGHLNGLEKLVFVNRNPFSGEEPKPAFNERICWVEPRYVVQVRFLEWTDDGKLRHGRIVRHEDKC